MSESGESSFACLWEYDVEPARIAAFERAYGSEGEWVALFRRSPDYLGTDLLRDRDRPGRYVTIDRWRSAAAREAFLRAHQSEYSELDARCASLTRSERQFGDFSVYD